MPLRVMPPSAFALSPPRSLPLCLLHKVEVTYVLGEGGSLCPKSSHVIEPDHRRALARSDSTPHSKLSSESERGEQGEGRTRQRRAKQRVANSREKRLPQWGNGTVRE